jgi:hypothetical protein
MPLDPPRQAFGFLELNVDNLHPQMGGRDCAQLNA